MNRTASHAQQLIFKKFALLRNIADYNCVNVYLLLFQAAKIDKNYKI